MSFDFYSPGVGSMAAFGLDFDNTLNNPKRHFQLAGSNTTGSFAGILLDVPYTGGWQRYEIRLNDFPEGYAIGDVLNRFTFLNSGGDAESYFRNVRLTEGPPAATITASTSYSYDAEGRRVKRTHDPDGAGSQPAASQYFVYDGSELSMTFGNAGELAHRYLYGPAVDQVLVDEVFTAGTGGQRVSDEVLWLLADHQGTIRDIVNNNFRRKSLEYDSFGNIIQEDFYSKNGFSVAPTHAEAVDQLFYYTGREFDEATGLQNNRARWYDPQMGRFLNEDPSGFDAGDANLYRYVGNSPLNATDPTGLKQAGNPLDKLPGVAKPATTYAAPKAVIPTVDESLRQLTAPKSFDYYQNLAAAATVPKPSGRDVVGVQKIGGEALGDYFRRGADTVARDFEGGGVIDTIRWGIVKGIGNIAGGLTDTVLPPSDPGYLVTHRDGSRTYHMGEGPTTGALAAQASLLAPPVLSGAPRPAGQLTLRTPEPLATITPSQPANVSTGALFNRVRANKYPYNEVYVENPAGGTYRLDSYNPASGEIVSRKFTQLSEISDRTAVAYVREAATKYPPGAKIAKVPSSGPLAGQDLVGRVYLEVPVQINPVPKKVLDAANRTNVTIRDIHGRQY